MTNIIINWQKTAADAGVEYAMACNTSVIGLKPDTNCNGIALPPTSCPVDTANACHFVMSGNNIQSTFTVTSTLDADSTISDMVSTGTVNILKASDNSSVWRTYSQTTRLNKIPLSRRQIAVGADHTCFISYNNLAYCWGGGFDGELGNGSTSDSLVPVGVDTGGTLKDKTILSISAGEYHTCAIDVGGKAYCWGGNANGQIGNGFKDAINPVVSPVAVNTNSLLAGDRIFKSIAAGESHTCALTSIQNIYCWGDGGNGELGNGLTNGSLTPVKVDTTNLPNGYKTFSSIAVGTYHVCAVASDNRAYCWGGNGSGELGNNDPLHPLVGSLIPVAVYVDDALNGKTIISITAGWDYTCIIASDDQAYCWGYNGWGELGSGNKSTQLAPFKVITAGTLMYNKKIVSISGRKFHTCATDSGGKAYCWGYNIHGEFGNGMADDGSLVPVATWMPPYHANYF